MLRDPRYEADVTVAEAGTLIYTGRSEGPAQARIFRIEEAVPLAALPITRLASVIHHTDYWRRGRTLEKLGLANMTVGELTRYVNEGVRPQ